MNKYNTIIIRFSRNKDNQLKLMGGENVKVIK